jgi:pimeloyl-ACP methyl ester carboxylesterase
MTATYVLIPGAGGSPWTWHRVAADLRQRGHEVVAVDLPCDDESAGLAEYVDAAVTAVARSHHDDNDVTVVAHSLGGFTAAHLCQRVDVDLLVLLAAMFPVAGESPGEWWDHTGWDQARAEEVRRQGGDDSPEATFSHDLPPDLAAEVGAHIRQQSGTVFARPYPLTAWPDVPVAVLIGRDDRFFPADFQRRVTQERLGVVPDELACGHLPMLARPAELVSRLEAYSK